MAYEPHEIENKWSAFWEKEALFKADPKSKKPAYSISIPPPNVTGVLHMGHALVDTLQDVLIRWKRMSGFETLWVPGTDHAGIATQTVVERDQIAKTGKRRKDFSREEFLELVWQWKEKSEMRILDQVKRLGCSCDFSRLAFTMDETRSKAVRTLFKKMYEDGLIYRGDYLVNWDPVTQTALADDEVEYEERETTLTTLRYPLSDGSGFLEMATTRPETMFGDTAIAVSPKDPRFKTFIGKMIDHPLTGRQIPVIADNFVDPEFGTGAVKITPAHDPNDYEMGLRQNLPMINVMTPDGRLNEKAGAFAGLTMEEGRQAVIEELKKLGFIVKVEVYRHRAGVSYRSKAIIEPYLSKQWFVKMSPFKDKLIEAVKSGKVKIIPKEWESTYFHWIENLRDWCISRQLWWGHRIPIWYRGDEVLCYDGEGIPPEVEKDPQNWHQDEDVLDTWFSSALWPFSNLGWPEKTPELEKFYPNSVIVTGHDILFFWVARMIMMGEYVLDQVPFPETFLHGLIYGKSYWHYAEDGKLIYITGKERLDYDLGTKVPPTVHFKWEKMSKSKGNVIDPIEIIDSYGTDAMRMTLTSLATHARQIDLDRRRIEEQKNFMNKLWNGAQFVLSHIEGLSPKGIDHDILQLEDKWILSRLSTVTASINRYLDEYAFDKAAGLAYDFFWNEFCAYYLELVKPTLFGKLGTEQDKENKRQILFVMLTSLVRLFHPIIPFITEELFSMLKKVSGSSEEKFVKEALDALKAPACAVAPYPTSLSESDPVIEETFAFMNELLYSIRTIRADMQLPPSAETSLYLSGPEKEIALIKDNETIIKALIKTQAIHYGQPPEGFSASGFARSVSITIPLPEELKEKEKLRLEKIKEKLIAQQNGALARLGNRSFVEGAPKEVVDKVKASLESVEKELSETEKKLQMLT